jgi:tetratricopeptide (TPR) repeat protein
MRVDKPLVATLSGLAAFFCLVVVAAMAPVTWRLWGADGLAYAAAPARWTALAMVAIVAAAAGVLAARPNRGLDPFVCLLAALPAACAILLPAATALRGDGQFILTQLTDPFANAAAPAWYSTLAHAAAALGVQLGQRLGLPPLAALRALDGLAGLVFGAAVVLHARRFAAPAARVITAIALSLSGSLPLIAGLVEYYAPVHALAAMALVLTGRAIARDRAPWAGLVVTLLAAVNHAEAAVLLPAFVIAWPGRWSVRRRQALFLAAGLAGLAAWAATGGKGLLAPLGPPAADGYALLDPRHLEDLANLLLWAAPVVLFILLPWTLASRRWARDREAAFYLAATVASLSLAAAVAPDLGMARDADLLSLFALPAALWGLRVLASGPVDRVLVPAALLVGLLGPAAQVAAQSRESMAVARHERQLELDPRRSAYGWETLGIHHRLRGESPAEERAFELAMAHSGNPRYHIRLGRLALDRGDLAAGLDHARAVVAAFPNDPRGPELMARALVLQDRLEEAQPLLIRAIERGSRDLDTYVELAYETLRGGHVAQTRGVLEAGQRRLYATDGRFHCLLGIVAESEGRAAEARAQYATALDLACPAPFDALAAEGERRMGKN